MHIAELWGTLLGPRLVLPERPLLGYALLSLYAILFLVLLGRTRASLKPLTWRRLFALIGLGLAAPVAGRLLSLTLQFENQPPPLAAVQNPATTLTLLAAIPSLVGAATLGPAAALLIGFGAGLGRALWQSHQLLDPFHYALSAYLAAIWLQQAYHGRVYRWLRQPIVAGLLSSLSQAPLVALATFVYAEASASALAAFDLALSTAGAYLPLVAAEGVLAGLVVSLLLMGLPQWRPAYPPTPSPQERSLRARLLTNFGLFAAALLVVFLILVYYLSVGVATRLVVDQMAHNAQGVVARLPDFTGGRLSLLRQYSQDDTLLNGDRESQATTLRQLYRAGAYYRRVLLVDNGGQVQAFYPPDSETIQLTGLEETAVANVIVTTAPSISPAQPPNGDHHIISLIVPVLDANEQAAAVLVGRVPDVSFNELIAVLQGTAGRGSGFIVDQNAQIIAHPDPASLLSNWTPPVANRRPLATPGGTTGTAYEGRDSQTNSRQLVYYETAAAPPWTVVTTVPYEVVLNLALQISAPLTGLLLVAMALFALNLRYLGRSVTAPLTELATASQDIAGGQLNTPIQLSRQDEVGQLGQALDKMRLALRERLEELSLLLSVSQNITSSIDINQGMPEILRGALRGTGAAGARVVVLNPSGRYPLLYEQGPAAPQMALLDRKIMRQLRQAAELRLTNPSEIRADLEVEAGHELPVQSLLAIPLLSQKRIQGVFWLGYRHPHTFEQSELNLLRTLAGQAAVLVENARLFATAESGRRRLAAVLASTADAVIVTDPTERILLINPAMEKAFGLKAAEVVGRPVADVLKAERLVEALTRDGERARNVEVATVDGRTLYASPSSIVSADG
ncbi:MAG: HAMP domain-containing protein, partial [Chloroflexota bacterium]